MRACAGNDSSGALSSFVHIRSAIPQSTRFPPPRPLPHPYPCRYPYSNLNFHVRFYVFSLPFFSLLYFFPHIPINLIYIYIYNLIKKASLLKKNILLKERALSVRSDCFWISSNLYLKKSSISYKNRVYETKIVCIISSSLVFVEIFESIVRSGEKKWGGRGEWFRAIGRWWEAAGSPSPGPSSLLLLLS